MQEGYRSVGFARLCFERLLPLVVLNILFLLTCLPVLTASAGWTALCSACQGLLLDEKQPYRRFWRAFRVNFLPSLLLGVIFFAGPAAVLYGCWFYLPSLGENGVRSGDILLLSDLQLSAVVRRLFCLFDAGAGGTEVFGAAEKCVYFDLSLSTAGAWLAAAFVRADGGGHSAAAVQLSLAGAAGRGAALLCGIARRAPGH